MGSGRAPRRALGRFRKTPLAKRVRASIYAPIVSPLRWLNAGLRRLCALSHHLQYKVEGFLRPSAEWFDHEIDVQWQWVAKQRMMFLERGILNTLAIGPEASILEICCGDGFNAHRFYAERGRQVLAVDHNAAALKYARRVHSRPNIEYRHCNILEGIPEGPFQNIIWDSAIHHFSLPDVAIILASIHRSLANGGVLSGYTEIEPGEEYSYARLRFRDPDRLADLLGREFPHVSVIETPDPLRRNLYFFASDSAKVLPFGEGIHRGWALEPEAEPAPEIALPAQALTH